MRRKHDAINTKLLTAQKTKEVVSYIRYAILIAVFVYVSLSLCLFVFVLAFLCLCLGFLLFVSLALPACCCDCVKGKARTQHALVVTKLMASHATNEV